MEDLSRKLERILSDPEAMEQIKELTGLFSQKQEAPSEPIKTPEPAFSPDPEMLGRIMKLAPLLSSVNKEDDSTRLLRALKPFLHEERSRRVDSAIRLLGIIKLLPVLKGSGLDLFGIQEGIL